MSRRRYWLKLLLVGLVGAVVMLYAGYTVLFVWAMSAPARRPVCCRTPADLGLDYEDVSLHSGDGVLLAGWYIPSQNGAAVLLLHGYGAHRGEVLDRAALLAGHGYGTLLYDARASGESGGELRSFGWADVDDVRAALAYLQAREDVEPGRLGILGFSIGGQIALRATAEMEALRAVVAEEPGFATAADLPAMSTLGDKFLAFNYRIWFKGLEWRTGLRAPAGVVEGLARIPPRPLLMMASGQPEEPNYWLVRYLYDQAAEPKDWWAVPEAAHGQIPVLRPAEYEDKIVSFFDKALLGGE
jgi:dienelactone hydrolase